MLRSKKIDAYRLKLLLKHLNGDIIDNIFFLKKNIKTMAYQTNSCQSWLTCEIYDLGHDIMIKP